jgi:hypothetical protein
LVEVLGRVAIAGAFAIFIGGAFFTPQLAAPDDAPFAAAPAATIGDIRLAADEARDERDAESSGGGFTDLYGNEVNDALATYTLDQSGSLYELHSPRTELPRLGIPKS